MKILVAGGEPYALSLIRRVLAEYTQIEAIEAGDHESVIKGVLENSPDLVILDFYHPEFPGLDLIEEIKEKRPSAEIIVCMGSLQEDKGKKALKLGAWDCVAKPFEINRLKSLLDLWLYLRKPEKGRGGRGS